MLGRDCTKAEKSHIPNVRNEEALYGCQKGYSPGPYQEDVEGEQRQQRRDFMVGKDL